jgi:hypothetical protein
MVGRPTPLWELHRPLRNSVICWIEETDEGCVYVRITGCFTEPLTATFETPEAAVKWGCDVQAVLVTAGWSLPTT